MSSETDSVVPRVTRLRVRDFASIAECDVALGLLTVLVGFNAAGKSSFLDALRFLSDALATSPGRALSSRGGLDRVLHRTADNSSAESFTIEVDLQLASDVPGEEPMAARYSVEIGRDRTGRFPLPIAVRSETCAWTAVGPDGLREWKTWNGPGSFSDRLFLPVMAVEQGVYRVIESALTAMRFYEFDSTMLRRIDDDIDRRSQLGSHGEHLGQILGRIATNHPEVKEQLDSYLRALVPQSLGVDERRDGDFSTIQARFWAGDTGLPFWRAVANAAVQVGDSHVRVFQRQELSEGTVQAAGVLAALFQPDVLNGTIPLVAIEEPESAIHPSNVGALYDAVHEASRRTQVIVTTQSADFLDSEHADVSHIIAVKMVNGATRIGPVDDRTREFLTREPSRLAELHRQGQLDPAGSDGVVPENTAPDEGER